MKKFILNVIAALFFSCLTFANTSEIKTTSNLDFKTIDVVNETKSNTQINEDDFWFCYEVSRKKSYNVFSNETTVTVTYHCTWHNL